jgi:hypothetical protein
MSKARKQRVVEQQRPVAAVEEQDEQRPSEADAASPVVDRALVAQLIGGARVSRACR